MLLTTIEQIVSVIPTIDGSESGFEYSDFESYVISAERWLKDDILGKQLYELLNEASTPEDHTVLLSHCRTVVTLKMYYDAIPYFDITQTKMGLGVVSNQNVAPASKERVAKLRNATLERHYSETEELIRYLEGNENYHDYWKVSEAFSLAYDLLVPTAKIFDHFVTINESRQLFNKIKQSIRQAQDIYIAQAISTELLEEIIEQVKDGDLSNPNKDILIFLRRACSNVAFADAVDNMSLVIDVNGIIRSSHMNTVQVASESRMMELVKHHRKVGDYYLGMAMKIINANLDDYGTYTNSSVYADKQGEYKGYNNSQDSTLFVSP